MRTFISATLLTGALLYVASFAQTAPPSGQNPSAPAEQTQAQPQAQQPPEATQAPASTPAARDAAQPPAQHRIAPGSVIPVQLVKTIDAKKAKPGDEVVAKVTMDLKTNAGEVIVPKDTKVVGHVTEAQARNKDQKESQLGIAFDRAALRDGEMSLPMSIQAVIALPGNNANNGGGNDQGSSTPSSSAGTPASSPMGGGRTGSVGSAGQTQSSNSSANSTPTGTSQEGNTRPEINGNTQGVVGISNLKLEAGQNATQGSVLSSEKNNVKVESGTMLLLKVNP
jgi:hypothetical protein